MVQCKCIACGNTFNRKPSHIGSYCSNSCASKSRPRISPLVRFLDKVTKTDGCWNWTGSLHSNGYGHLFVDGRLVYAHRFSYAQYVGPIPDGLNVLHTCDNPACVKPSHLYAGSQKQNGLDASARARMPRGIGHHAVKLTPIAVREIRALAGSIPQTAIAKRFGVCQQTVCDIVRRRYWRHV